MSNMGLSGLKARCWQDHAPPGDSRENPSSCVSQLQETTCIPVFPWHLKALPYVLWFSHATPLISSEMNPCFIHKGGNQCSGLSCRGWSTPRPSRTLRGNQDVGSCACPSQAVGLLLLCALAHSPRRTLS